MKSLFQEFYLPSAGELNDAVIAEYRQALASENVKKTHLFAGRYENIYVDHERLPSLSGLVAFWVQSAARVLSRDDDKIRCGYWFNDMQPGDVTLPHSHDDYDEWLSGVYYLKVPQQSGNLILHSEDERVSVIPEEGKLVLFSSSNVHEVEENRSRQARLSIGINFGPVSD